MAKLYFRYGVMGSSKTANALMVAYNYEERGQRVLMAKPRLDQRDGDHIIRSRTGMERSCSYIDEIRLMPQNFFKDYDCIIVDEAQFMSPDDVAFLTDIVDLLKVPVICYGLRADFQGNLFPGSTALLAMADSIEEVKTICWCGKKATFNARFDEHGTVLKDGEQVVLGANEQYTGLCRAHWKSGNIGVELRASLKKAKKAELPTQRAVVGVKPIDSFRGEFYFLSNFYEAPVTFDGLTYRNNEAAFQAQKTVPTERKQFCGMSPSEAKYLGRSVSLRTDWEAVKEDLMYQICLAKFTQNKGLGAKLLATGDATLIEGNNWRDREWGVVNGQGKNKLGLILMRVRDELRKECL